MLGKYLLAQEGQKCQTNIYSHRKGRNVRQTFTHIGRAEMLGKHLLAQEGQKCQTNIYSHRKGRNVRPTSTRIGRAEMLDKHLLTQEGQKCQTNIYSQVNNICQKKLMRRTLWIIWIIHVPVVVFIKYILFWDGLNLGYLCGGLHLEYLCGGLNLEQLLIDSIQNTFVVKGSGYIARQM